MLLFKWKGKDYTALGSRKFSLVQSLIWVRFFSIPRTAALQASLSITNSWSLLKFMSIVSVMPSKHLILCCPLFLLPSIFPSIRIFFSESIPHIRWPRYWSFSPQDWFPLGLTGLISLQSKGTLKSLLQHHSSKASILWRSGFKLYLLNIHHKFEFICV